MRALVERARAFYHRSGFILNLRRVWLLILIWAILANLAIATNREIFFRLSYLILLVVAAAFLWALYSVQAFRLERTILTLRAQVSAPDACPNCGSNWWMAAICPVIPSDAFYPPCRRASVTPF
ncbi:MAG: hypothetical protein DCC52_08595 [Chloroflexi bacterium]|nr:MAG: hypothetical protein DCC52_08595 [Chloroflexota bacterium]